MEVQGEEEVETDVAMEISTPTLEELASVLASSPTGAAIPIYSMVLSIPQVPPSPTPIQTITNCNASFPNPPIIRYALGQGLHPSLPAQQEALVQSTMSAHAPISSPIVAPTPFSVHLDHADMDFLKKKSEECK